MLPTYRPRKCKRAKSYGFRARMRSHGGRKLLSRRRQKGRHRIIPQ